MSMVKLVSPAGWDFEGPTTSLIKVSSRGLIGTDRSEFIKRAGHVFLPFIDRIKVADGEEPVHQLIVGSTEGWGANRNGDGFDEKECREHHHTFVKHARAFRNHRNKDPKISYGVIKASAYNEPMRRIELLACYNKTKEAADRNGGLVADKELAKLARDGSLALSMAARVKFDVCSYCEKNANAREDYCTDETCKAGGCKDNLGKLVKVGSDLHHLHVKNPSPLWFDSSLVHRPADRTAYGAPADWLTKAASDHGYLGIGGAKLAEDLSVTVPMHVLLAHEAEVDDLHLAGQVKLACALAELEGCGPGLPAETLRAFTPKAQLIDFASIAPEKRAEALAALADTGVVVPFNEFARLAGQEGLAKQAAPYLPGVYRRLVAEGNLAEALRNNSHPVSPKQASLSLRRWAARYHNDLALTKEAVHSRCVLSAVRGESLPNSLNANAISKSADSINANAIEPAAGLARSYALYKVAALHRMAAEDNDFLLTARLGLLQNCAS